MRPAEIANVFISTSSGWFGVDRLTDRPGENGSGDRHEQHVCSREGAEARFDDGTESSDDDGEFAARNEGEPSPQA